MVPKAEPFPMGELTMRPVHTDNSIPFGIKLEQSESGGKLFRVTYGLQAKDNLSYVEAANEYGLCLFHALACAGLIDNEGE